MLSIRHMRSLLGTMMIIGLLSGYVTAQDLSVHLRMTKTPPVIDGFIDDVWHQADSTCQFIQKQPYDGEPITEPTTAYFLQDKNALYVAFRCETPGRRPDCVSGTREVGSGDIVILYLDTFLDRRKAYRFSVNCAGIQGDATISANGAEENISWDGVFSTGALVDSQGYAVEMAIPWSTLRFDNEATSWGFNLERRIPQNNEIAYFAAVSQDEAFTVSNFGLLEGVRPTRQSMGIELFPRIFYRTEKAWGDRSSAIHLAADLNWAISPAIRLQSTFNPDFSQVEADPFSLNLSRYALYFDEERPFFVEGQEYFEPSGGVMANQMELFYSRQIGKKLDDGSEVPFDAGTRLIGTIGKLEFGSLACATGSKEYDGWFGPAEEQSAVYTVDRLNYQPFSHTTVGVMYAGKINNEYRNDVFSIDGSTSTSKFEFSYQLANSYFDGTSDWAFNSYLSWSIQRKLFFKARAKVIGDEFDVSEIGYLPWVGYRNYSISMAPAIFPRTGILKYGAVRTNVGFSREYLEKDYSHYVAIMAEAALRNGWGLTLSYRIGREYERDTNFNPKSFSARVSTDVSRRFWVSNSYSTVFAYNYLQRYFARNDYVRVLASWRQSKRLSSFVSSSTWIQRKPDGGVETVVYRLRQGIYYTITPGMMLKLYEETPFEDGVGVLSFRIGASFKYNFLPKSWLYIAYNDYQLRRDDKSYYPQVRVFAIKIKHLIAW